MSALFGGQKKQQRNNSERRGPMVSSSFGFMSNGQINTPG